MIAEGLKWIAAAAWLATCLWLVDAVRPLRRDEAVWRVIAPEERSGAANVARRGLCWLGTRIRRLIPRSITTWVKSVAAAEGNRLGDEGWLGVMAVGGVVGVAFLLPPFGLHEQGLGKAITLFFARTAFGWTLGCVTGLACLHHRVSDRRGRIVRELPHFVDLLSLGLDGGMNLGMAMTEAASRLEGPLRDEFSEVERRVALGIPRAEALAGMAERLGVRELTAMVSLLCQSEALGSGVAGAVGAIARRLRTARVLAAERRAGEAPVKMLFPLVFCLFPSVLVLLIGPLLVGRGTLLNW